MKERSSNDLLKEPGEVSTSADAKALEKLFEELTRCKEDDQQRNWMLYEDEGRIMKLLNHVCDRLQNAPHNASLHVLKRFKYFYVNNLIEYYQMEVRWSLRRLLIEAFLLMCYLDANIISIMLNSVLPLELVQDIYQTKVSYIYILRFIYEKGRFCRNTYVSVMTVRNLLILKGNCFYFDVLQPCYSSIEGDSILLY